MKTFKQNKIKVISIIVLLFIISLLSINSFAKYINNESNDVLVVPSNFFLSSDYLKETNALYNVYNWDDGVIIELYNSIDINKSEIDIPYTVSVVNGNSNVNNGVITTSEEKDTIIIYPININNPVTVSVTSNTYTYTLSATFNFTSIGINSYYSFSDSDKYCELTIFTGNSNVNNITVNWNSNYIPDNANQLMKNWSGTTGSLSLSRSTKYKLIFFKNTNNICSNIMNTEIQNNIITLP